ncbi:MAG: hypothetical protein JNL08_04675 [Planctomycetes bacterium]|nr:hypothetical protein [Planctomycetota bacterium]
MSNRDRIAHLRAEAEAAAKEKAAAKAAKAAQPAARKAKGKTAPAPARVRIVWAVCDHAGKEVQQFPYAQEQEARAEAQRLTAASGRTHFVKQTDVAVE